MVSRQSCLKYSSWREARNPCLTFDAYAQEICCLGFRGDASSTPDFNYAFNTSYEMVMLLHREDLRPLLSSRPIFIAINFQYSDSQNNLTKTFLYDLMKCIKDLQLNVTIATGTDNIILDYDFKCVIQNACKNDSVAQFISESGIVLQSGEEQPFHPHDVRKRYRNFNVYYKGVASYCQNGFPSWVDKWDYPLIFWEPSNEQQIQLVAKTFTSDKCKRPTKHNNLSWVAIASNLEPEMFETYLANYEGQPMGKKLLLQNTSNVLLSRLAIDGKDVVLVSYRQDGNQKLQLRDSNLAVLKEISMETNISTLRAEGSSILATVQNGSGTYSRVYNSALEPVKEWLLGEKFLTVDYFNGFAYYIKQVSSTYYNLLITDDGKSATVTGCDLRFSPTDMIMADQLYVVGSNNGSIFLSYNCSATVQIGFGSSASISVSKRQEGVPQQLQILISDGMCQSAVFANNNEMNKCTFYLNDEFVQLKSVPSLINFVSGSTEDFKSIKDSKDPITACHSRLFAGKVANGNKPSPVMLGGKLLLAYEYVPLNKQPLITTLFCGASNYDKVQVGSHTVLSWFSLPGLPTTKEMLE